MDATTAAARLDELIVVDVREPEEWDAGHIDGAIHIPIGELAARRAELDRDDARKLLFVCRVGGRSAQATEYFVRLGYDAENLDGGMLVWDEARLPIVTDDGKPGVVAMH